MMQSLTSYQAGKPWVQRVGSICVLICAIALFTLISGCSFSNPFHFGASEDDTNDWNASYTHEVSEGQASSESSEELGDQSSTTPAYPLPEQPKKPLQDKVILIDPGHQAHANLGQEQIGPGSRKTKYKVTGGARGVSTGVYEYELNLDVGLKLKKRLEDEGARVLMTRESHDVDITNIERAQMGNEAGADLVIRIHADGGETGTEHGFLTLVPQNNQWCAPIYDASMQAGKDIHAACLKATGAVDRGVHERGDLTGFNWSKVPVVLVEMGYMTTPDEDRLMQTDAYQAQLVEGMTQGSITFLTRSS